MAGPELELEFPLRWYQEGAVRFVAPLFEETDVGEPKSPSKIPVFYNPFSKPSRDMTILAVEAMGLKSVLAAEPLAGCGVRGIRLLKETTCVEGVFLNDINSQAVKVIEYNARHNLVVDRVRIFHLEASIFLTQHSLPEKRFQYVDIDPVGSPSRFVENGLRACATGGLLGVSATDLAPLVGRHPTTCLRKYDAQSFASDFSKELALRILAGYVVRAGMPVNIAAKPVLSFYHRHFVRVFLRVERGRGRCMRLLKGLGWVQYCRRCRDLKTLPIHEMPERVCGLCGGKTSVAGPLWIGPLHDRNFTQSAHSRSARYPETAKILDKIVEEVDAVGFYTVPSLARMSNKPPPPPSKLVEKLRQAGFQASHTHIDPEGVKTDATPREIMASLKDM
ncbi:tRNA (guanine(26)-N(2)/guanine(27)-N(2))-dimethyltransferase [archaeon HR01]|nr:tRNA (guanine(26)-N(2)/guanine(27)-N(2))-dimethyltransferase [archaeon HR01]